MLRTFERSRRLTRQWLSIWQSHYSKISLSAPTGVLISDLLGVPETIIGSIAAEGTNPCGCPMREKALRMPTERNGCSLAYQMQGTLGTPNVTALPQPPTVTKPDEEDV